MALLLYENCGLPSGHPAIKVVNELRDVNCPEEYIEQFFAMMNYTSKRKGSFSGNGYVRILACDLDIEWKVSTPPQRS